MLDRCEGKEAATDGACSGFFKPEFAWLDYYWGSGRMVGRQSDAWGRFRDYWRYYRWHCGGAGWRLLAKLPDKRRPGRDRLLCGRAAGRVHPARPAARRQRQKVEDIPLRLPDAAPCRLA